jgi:predicted RNase H-like HicB family nuclease
MKRVSRNGNGNGKDVKPWTRASVRFASGERFIEVTLQFELEGDLITGLCLELGSAAFGETPQEADEALVEAIALQLDTLEEVGELEDFLERNGVKLQRGPRWNAVSPQLVPV